MCAVVAGHDLSVHRQCSPQVTYTGFEPFSATAGNWPLVRWRASMLGGWRLAHRVPPEAWVVGFWSAALALMWTWCAYPLALLLLTARRRHPASLPADTSSTPQPVMSVVIAAHNEEHVIGQRVDNCLELAWPTDKLEVVVVSDGSTDRTDEIVRGFSDPRVKLVRTDRVGKSLAQNRAIAEARGQ